MAFTQVVKNKAYFKRFQVKYRRRREGKTDYYARKRLITQDKNKYNSPKYRLVVRFTNRDCIAQIVEAKIAGDHVLCAAYAHELPRYGLKHGLTNWSAAYATGLLLARRVLAKLKLDDKYEGVVEPAGEYSVVEPVEDEARPFKVYLDVGTRRTTSGSRIFGVMKGASDGGLYVPHNEKRFPGYDPDSKELDTEVLRNYIFGEHVAEYMRMLEDEDPERYQAQFSGLIADGIGADDLEDIYAKCHAAIRENPEPAPKKEHDMAALKKASQEHKTKPRNLKQRLDRIKQKKQHFEAMRA